MGKKGRERELAIGEAPPADSVFLILIFLVPIVFVLGFCALGQVYPGLHMVGGAHHPGRMEINQIEDIIWMFNHIAEDDVASQQLQEPGLREMAGRDLYEALIRRRLLEIEATSKLLSLKADGCRADPEAFANEGSGELPVTACSYTSPKAGELLDLFKSKRRVVLITFNDKNWNNYPDEGVVVAWADGTVEFMDFDDAEDDWGITEAEWDDPAGRLFGKKAPFQHTYE